MTVQISRHQIKSVQYQALTGRWEQTDQFHYSFLRQSVQLIETVTLEQFLQLILNCQPLKEFTEDFFDCRLTRLLKCRKEEDDRPSHRFGSSPLVSVQVSKNVMLNHDSEAVKTGHWLVGLSADEMSLEIFDFKTNLQRIKHLPLKINADFLVTDAVEFAYSLKNHFTLLDLLTATVGVLLPPRPESTITVSASGLSHNQSRIRPGDWKNVQSIEPEKN